MNIIFFSKAEGRARHFNLTHPVTLAITSVIALAVFGSIFALGMALGQRSAMRAALLDPKILLRAEQSQLSDIRNQVQDRLNALAVKLGVINAHVVRIDALGKRLTALANINSREFDFDHDPPVGGPEGSRALGQAAQATDLSALLDSFSRRVDQQTAQYTALESVLVGQDLSAQILPTGRPVREGYISSVFGARTDPFDGESAFHKGVDFAASSGSDVLAVASGIVTYAGPREGYGNLVEISHGNGLSTRYGHSSQVLVRVGDQVERGQTVALVGSTGRSTGPHVHLEVLRDGHQIDPMIFLGR